jgi:multidrug efflux pump subunit AcrA (membrane-fusion protein)
MKKSVIVIGFMLLAILVAACGGGPAPATPTPGAALPPVIDNAAIKAEGKLEPVQSANLSFATSGEVTEVLVKEGDTVKANDLIARLRADAQQAAVARAEAGVAVAKASLAKYQEQLPQLIASAEADVQSAQAQIAAASARRDNRASIASAEAALAQAVLNQKQVQDAYDDILKHPALLGPTEERARLMLENAKRATQAAQLRLNQLKAGSMNDRANAAEVAAAEAQLQAVQANLDELKAEANDQPNPTYAAAVHQAEAALKSAQTRLADTELRAPFAGTIAQATLKVGETAAPGSAIIVLADFSGWQIETDDLTEIKVPAITIGQGVTVKFDALPDVALKGKVQAIGQLYQEKSGDIVYPVKINLVDVDPALRWGMTAQVTFAQ